MGETGKEVLYSFLGPAFCPANFQDDFPCLSHQIYIKVQNDSGRQVEERAGKSTTSTPYTHQFPVHHTCYTSLYSRKKREGSVTVFAAKEIVWTCLVMLNYLCNLYGKLVIFLFKRICLILNLKSRMYLLPFNKFCTYIYLFVCLFTLFIVHLSN